MLRGIKKRLFVFLISCLLCFSSVFVSYQKAYASVTVATGATVISFSSLAPYVVLGLLAITGVGLVADNKQDLEALGLTVYEEFTEFASTFSKEASSKITAWIESAKSGLISLRGEWDSCWKAFKAYVQTRFYDIGFGAIVGDTRPNIADWPYKAGTDHLATFLSYYTDTESYPYYLILDRNIDNPKETSLAYCFDSVPLIYLSKGNVYVFWSSVPGIATEFHRYSVYKSGSSYWSSYQTKNMEVANSNLLTISNYDDGISILDSIQSNITIFNSREDALNWWNNEGIGGVVTTPTDIPVVKIPDTAPDVIYGRDDALGNYDVIGGTSYIDEDGKVVAGDVALPSWDTLVGVGQGETTWDDVIGLNVPIDKPVDSVLEDATDIPIVKDDDFPKDPESIKDVLENRGDMVPFLADLKDIFPFCIPFDLISCIELFNAEPETPCFDWKFDFRPVLDFEYSYRIDLTPFNDVAYICRIMFTICFIVSLIVSTRNLIRG